MTAKDKAPVVVDTTLRDGLQMPGIHLDLQQKTSILGLLSQLGITEVEIGCPARGAKDIFEMNTLCNLYPHIHYSAWCRARKDDINHAVESGVDTIHISFPTSNRHMKILSWTPQETLGFLQNIIPIALSKAPYVTIGAQDATRADICFLNQFVQTAVKAGAKRIRIADTVGIATPTSITSLIDMVKQNCPEAHLEFHGHNDFGLATASALAAINAGADAVSATVLGVGERAGNAALEEVLTAGKILYGFNFPYAIEYLSHLCNHVSDIFNLPEQPNKAITGKNAFRHESGIHCHGVLRDTLAYQPFSAETVGRKSRISLGTQSGVSSLEGMLLSKGIHLNHNDVKVIWEELHEHFT